MSAYRVNLFIPGSGKSGTTSLHNYLNQHPAVCMSTVKEPQYFAVDAEYKKGAFYHNSLFDYNSKKDIKYYGESSTTYFLSLAAVQRIAENINSPKFIFLLRNPIDRIYSHFYWIRNRMDENVLPFQEEIIRDMSTRYDPNKPLSSGAYKNYVEESSYGSAIDAYIKKFGAENIYISTTEQLKTDPLKVLNGCFKFLGLSPMSKIDLEMHNITPPNRINMTPVFLRKISFMLPDSIFRKLKNNIISSFFTKYEPVPVITQKQRDWLKQILLPEVEKLRAITGEKFEEWSDFIV